MIEAVAARVLDLMGTVDALHDESKYLAVVGFADQKVVPNCVPSIAHMPADGAGRNPKKSAAQRPAPMLKAIRRRDRPARLLPSHADPTPGKMRSVHSTPPAGSCTASSLNLGVETRQLPIDSPDEPGNKRDARAVPICGIPYYEE